MKQITADARYVEESYMAYTKTEWKDRTVENARTFTMTENDDGTVTLEEAPGEVYEAGTPLNAENMNHIEDGIEQISIDTEDTSWFDAQLTSNFKLYTDGSKCQYRKIGKTVYIRGVVSPNRTITGNTDAVTIFTLPDGFRPSRTEYCLCQGSAKNIWFMDITVDGDVRFSRYGASTWASADTNTWLPFSYNFSIN